jgi:hypothetical protein
MIDFVKLLLVGLVATSLLVFVLFDYATSISFFTASISYFFVIVATSSAYKKMVLTNLQNGNLMDDRDAIDMIDDRYGLWDEEQISDEQMMERIKKAKRFSFANGLKDTASSFTAAANIYRIGAYVVLVVLFFILKNNELLKVGGYLGGFVCMSVMLLGLKYYEMIKGKASETQDLST